MEMGLPLCDAGRIVQQRCGRRPFIDARVGDEERVNIPERDDEPAARLVGTLVAE